MADIKAARSAKTCFVEDGEKRGPLTIARLCFHPGSRFLLAACVDRRLALWDLDAAPRKEKKGEFVVGSLVCPHDAGWVRGFDVHPRGESILTGGSDRHLKLWKWEGDKPSAVPVADVVAHEGWIEAVAFSPDGQLAATVGADRKLKLWDAAKLNLSRSAPAHGNFPRDLAFSPDGKVLVTGGEDGLALVWDVATLKVVREINAGMTSDQQGQNPSTGGISRLGLSHDGRWLLVSGDRQSVVFELSTGHAVGAIGQAGGDALFGRKRNLLAVGSNSLRLLSFEPGQFKPRAAQVKLDAKGKQPPANYPQFPGKEVTQIKRGDFSFGAAFSADDGLLAVGKTDGTVELWTLS